MLGVVGETLLTPLYARANAERLLPGIGLRDPLAAGLLERAGHDPARVLTDRSNLAGALHRTLPVPGQVELAIPEHVDHARHPPASAAAATAIPAAVHQFRTAGLQVISRSLQAHGGDAAQSSPCLSPPPSTPLTHRQEVIAGVRAMVPWLIGVAPYGLVIGVSAAQADIPTAAGWLTGPAIYSGSAQVATMELLDAGAARLIVVATALAINARLILYSGSMAGVMGARNFRDTYGPKRRASWRRVAVRGSRCSAWLQMMGQVVMARSTVRWSERRLAPSWARTASPWTTVSQYSANSRRGKGGRGSPELAARSRRSWIVAIRCWQLSWRYRWTTVASDGHVEAARVSRQPWGRPGRVKRSALASSICFTDSRAVGPSWS